MPWPGTTPGRAFAPTVIVFIPLSDERCNSRAVDMDWLPKRCPVCKQEAMVGHGRRWRQAHDLTHRRFLVRRARCKKCGRTHTVLPPECVPGTVYNLLARQQALRRLADGATAEDAAPDCADPDRVADPATVRRWFWRRIQSLRFILWRAPTTLAWDWFASRRILIAEPVPV